MTTHPKIAALRAELESERNLKATEHAPQSESMALDVYTLPHYYIMLQARADYKSGHETATARLLPILERATWALQEIEMAERILHKDTGLGICSRIASDFLKSLNSDAADEVSEASAAKEDHGS